MHPIRALRISCLLLFTVLLWQNTARAQAFQGYTLYSPNNSRSTYLIDMNNTRVHSWSHTRSGGYSCYLLPDGSLIRGAVSSGSILNGGAAMGIVQRVSWSGALLWEYTYSTNTYRSHHDIEPMPNGNVLVIAWEVKTSAQSLQAGLNHSASLWPDHIIEVQPVGTTGGNIVWEWHFWDHLIQDYSSAKSNFGVVANHPELLDINVGSTSGDWMHVNGISYNPERDQIVFSSHNLDEFYVIDHGTTTAQAASHSGGTQGKGGDLLYRWGRPANYRASGTQVFNVVHNSNWIPAGLPGAGNILVFNNREGQGTSIVMEIAPPVTSSGAYTLSPGQAYGPTGAVWSYTASGFYSNHLGGCQRLPNGNTLIVQSTSGRMFEVNTSGTVVWNYQPGGEIVRAQRYPASYSGLVNLPVTFTAFRGVQQGNDVALTWNIASETSNHGFEVQRRFSTDDAWEAIGFVPGRGTTDVPMEYTYDDPVTVAHRTAGTVGYRLRQIDTDGSAHLSSLVEVTLDDAPQPVGLLQNYPNPVLPVSSNTTITNIQYHLQHEMMVSIRMHDAIGREVATLVEGVQPRGYHSVPWDVHAVTPGVYIVRMSAGGTLRTHRIVVGR